jgi:hypothetical protein
LSCSSCYSSSPSPSSSSSNSYSYSTSTLAGVSGCSASEPDSPSVISKTYRQRMLNETLDVMMMENGESRPGFPSCIDFSRLRTWLGTLFVWPAADTACSLRHLEWDRYLG